MTDIQAASDRLIAAYNAMDFHAMEAIIASDIDFAHFNRDFCLTDRAALISVLRQFATQCAPDRRFEVPERVTVAGDIVIREGFYIGTPILDLPGFGPAGTPFRLKFCSVMRFDPHGWLVEWKDYG